MFGTHFAFDQPQYLWLLALLPIFWAYSFRSLAGLGNFRRGASLLARSLVVLLVILALAEFQMVRRSEQLTVIFLLDQSESIPRDKREYMLDYVMGEVTEHRREDTEDRAGVVVFGGEAKIEIPPIDMDLPLVGRLETVGDLHPEVTSLEAAIELAKASFPEGTARRIVLVTDGNENLGDAQTAARLLAEDGIGIDIVPVQLPMRNEVRIEKVVIPSNLRQGQSFEAKVILEGQSISGEPQGVPGRLRLIERTNSNERLIAEEDVVVQPGTNVVGFKHQIDRTAMLTYEATFVPDDLKQDFRQQNNQASAYTHVRGKGRVLMIEDSDFTGEFDDLANRLRTQELDVELINSQTLFTSAEQLLEYDCIILANLPRSTGDELYGDDGLAEGAGSIQSFSDAQIAMLVRNVEEMGCGLVMLGGDRSMGAGGWANTLLEEAMPVDFQIKNDRIELVGALAMVMHATEMPRGNYWQVVIGDAAIETLGPMDYCGVVVWNDFGGGSKWLWSPQKGGMERVGPNRRSMRALVQKMTPGDMPDFDSSMRLALQGLSNVKASAKHMIIISDGDPSGPAPNLLQGFVDNNIVISTVAVGTHGGPTTTPLQRIAETTGGKFYNVVDPKALPKVFQREARRVSKPLIFERPSGIAILPTGPAAANPALQGIPITSLPPIEGYMATTIKDSPLVEQLLIAAEPDDGGENSTIYASWRYGLGRTSVITTDAGRRWAKSWPSQPYYDRLYAQVIRHAMRPVNESANFSVASHLVDGKVVVSVVALNEDDDFLNGLPMVARGLNPNLEGFDLPMRQVAPGRYEAQFDASDAGSYLFSILPGDGYERLSGGISVPVSNEYMDQETNWTLLETLASFEPRGGSAGKIIEGDLVPQDIQTMIDENNTFRHDLQQAMSIRDVWPWILVVGAALFFTDVFVRRVMFDPLAITQRIWQRIRRQDSSEPTPQVSRLDRLKSQKQQVQQQTTSRRFELTDAQRNAPPPPQEELTPGPAKPAPSRQPSREAKPAESQTKSYTQRLLDAKKRAQSDKEDDSNRRG